MRRAAGLLLVALALLAPAHPRAAEAALEAAAPLAFSQQVEPTEVRLGEPFRWTLVVTHPLEHRYDLTLPPSLGELELLAQTRAREDREGAAVTTFGLTLSAFALGPLTLPALTFEVSTPEGPRRFTVDGPALQVRSTLGEGAQAEGAELHDLQPPTEVPVRSWHLLGVLAALAALALAAWALVRHLRRARARAAAASAPLAPLDVRTRQALDALGAAGLAQAGEGREFYFRLSEIVRAYLGERYAFEALECTSTELMATLRRLRAPGLPEEGLERFVSESDLVKYARAPASPEACRGALAFGYELLERTWPPPPPAVPAPHAPRPHVP